MSYWSIAHYKRVVAGFLLSALAFYFSAIVSGVLSATYRDASFNTQQEWNSRVVSTLNAIVQTLLAVAMFNDVLGAHDFATFSPVSDLAFPTLVGYLIFDMCVCAVTPTLRQKSTFAHHIAGIVTQPLAPALRFGGVAYALFLFTEITTPFVNARWFLAVTERKHTLAYSIVGIALFVLFGVVRVGGCSWILLIWPSHAHELFAIGGAALHAITLAVALTVTSLNVYWFVLICRGVARALRRKSAKAKQY